VRHLWWYAIGGVLLVGLVTGGSALLRYRMHEQTYRIGFEDDPPFHFRDAQGLPTGLAIDVVKEAARRKGIRLQWVYERQSSEMALRSGNVDLWPIMTILAERKPFIHFTDPYRVSEGALMVRAASPFKSAPELDGRSVWFSGQPLGAKTLTAALPHATLHVEESPRRLIESVCHGEADAAYLDELTAISELLRGPDCAGVALRPITVTGSRGSLGIGSTFQAARVADDLRDGISDMADDGTLSEIIDRWTYFSGRSMELNSALVQAGRRERVMIGATAGAVSLTLAMVWMTLRILQQRNRVVRAEQAQRAGEEERARLSEQLQQAQRMESIGRLAGGVAHDFNNLLTVIGGYAELLGGDASLSEEQRAEVQQIAEAGRQASNLTQQLLAFSRKQVIQARALNLNTVVQATTTMLRRLVGEDVELVTVLDPGLEPVMADPSQMHQVLMNLVVNARDAMPKGGKVRISTANVALDAAAAAAHPEAVPGSYAALSVSDTGPGIDPAIVGHIFEPFFTTKAKGEGTGLGLSMVYGIVKQSRGWIAVSSEAGTGTTFTVYLPYAASGPDLAREGSEAAAKMPGTGTILLVEDQASVRALAVSVLRGCGYTVLEAESGEEAESMAAGHEGAIDLLLTDVVLPGMTGKDLADRLAVARPETAVLFTSGYAEDVIAHRGVLAPGIRYLPKPYAPQVLAAKVRESLDRARRAGSPGGSERP
jgi:signal transduction histidine kinase/ActR/RegA family two-component response regulator